MLTKSSSAYNDSVFHPNLSANNNFFSVYVTCIISEPISTHFFLFNIINIFLHLPLSVLIFHHGLQKWRQRRSTSSAAAMSHSDCFTYHLVTMELIGVTGCVMNSCVIYWKTTEGILRVSSLLLSFQWFGEVFFHLLTCVERYLAVVHPVIYLGLRRERGITIRNTSIGCVWALCTVGISGIITNSFPLVNFCLLIFSVAVVSFCSLSVLCVLIRPGPGEQNGGKDRVDQSKQRAFYTILAILGVLFIRFAWGLVWAIIYMSKKQKDCVLTTIDVWFNLPSSLVLSLLYLLRSGIFVCCKKNIQ